MLTDEQMRDKQQDPTQIHGVSYNAKNAAVNDRIDTLSKKRH